MNIPIVYEDDWLLVLNKPAGLLTVSAPGRQRRTLTGILNDDARQRGISHRFHPCHRLDRETSGLIIYAKGKAVQEKMTDLFRARKVHKRYIAFVHGHPAPAQGVIRQPIEDQAAVTEYKVVEKRKDFVIVEAKPLTGRTNQIRIHFKHIGHPVVGDTKYAFRRDFALKAKRLCLHAQELAFAHPVTQAHVCLRLDLPADLGAFLEKHP
ncbi:MAG TPA: RluA family pseudouridine synthase [Patescibacteria group bacterium]|nr:RluA family pseudouridine synthase [Patescibacteria group bacterium]